MYLDCMLVLWWVLTIGIYWSLAHLNKVLSNQDLTAYGEPCLPTNVMTWKELGAVAVTTALIIANLLTLGLWCLITLLRILHHS